MRRILAITLALLLLPRPTVAQSSTAPSTEPASSPASIVLTEAELTEILTAAIDEAVAPELAARRKAEAQVRAWKAALPWAVSGAVILAAAAFLGGVAVGAK